MVEQGEKSMLFVGHCTGEERRDTQETHLNKTVKDAQCIPIVLVLLEGTYMYLSI